MAPSDIEIAGWTPPPPPPRRALTYENPQPPVPPQLCSNMYPYTGFLLAPFPTAGPVGPGPSFVPSTAANHQGYGLPAPPSASGQQSQHPPMLALTNSTRPYTMFFRDHLRGLALMVFVPEQRHSMSTMSSPSNTPTAGSSTRATTPKPDTLKSGGPAAHDANGKRDPAQITIQLYFHSTSSPFQNNHGIKNVDKWCRQLQLSTAFHHLRKRLSEQGPVSAPWPTIHIEAYDAFAEYKDIINHSLNEREFRGLQGCYEYIERFLKYAKKRCADPKFVMPEHVVAKGRDHLEKRKFIKEQMEDIRNGDGGKNRRRRAALRDQLQPAFDDGGGPERNGPSSSFGSSWSFNHPQPTADQLMPAYSMNSSPSQALGTVSPQQLSLSPGPGQQDRTAWTAHGNWSPTIDPRLAQGAGTPHQQRPRPSPGASNAPLQASPQGQTRSGSQAPLSSPNLMPPPPTPSQGYQRPGAQRPDSQPPREGSLANPFRLAPFHLSAKSIYRGVSQPYHHIALVIDQPTWATTSGIGVLKFGYEYDWAKGDKIKRAGASFERVSMTPGTGMRWLGDALVDCFVGDGDQEVPAWLKDMQDDVHWPGSDGGSDEDFGIGVGVGNERMDDKTSRMLKKVSVMGAENVDFLDQAWTGLL